MALPTAFVGEPYSVPLLDYAESEWFGVRYWMQDEPAPGMVWSEADVRISGTPTETGSFSFSVEAIHAEPGPGECGTHPDPHVFRLDVVLPGSTDSTGTGTDGTSAGGGTTSTG